MDKLTLHGHGCTDIGLNRLFNEDFYDMNNDIYILADGMGGHNAGDVASKFVVEHLMGILDQIDNPKKDAFQNALHVQQIIQEAIDKTNQTLFEKSSESIEFKGMGTTLVLALFQEPDTMHIANVGDSRAYLFRDETIELLTEDHTVTAAMVRDKMITSNEAKTHPYRHHLTRSVGTSNDLKAFSHSFQLDIEDRILLCSDGLYNVLSKGDIIDSLQKNTDPKTICKDLIAKANKKESKDNISCIVIIVN